MHLIQLCFYDLTPLVYEVVPLRIYDMTPLFEAIQPKPLDYMVIMWALRLVDFIVL